MDWSHLLVALNPGTLTAALVSGVLLGLLVFPRLVRMMLEGVDDETAREINDLVAGSIIVAGLPGVLAFYLTQTIVEYLEGFETWPRIIGRGIVFVVYLFSLAVGVMLGQRWAARRKR